MPFVVLKYPVQGWRTYGMCAQNGSQKDFLGMRHSLLSNFFYFSFFTWIWITVATK